MYFDEVNERAKKFRLSVERDAFFEGVRLGFSWASDRYLQFRLGNLILRQSGKQEITMLCGKLVDIQGMTIVAICYSRHIQRMSIFV